MARPRNNFTLVRLCLALLVVLSHAVGINTLDPEPLKVSTGYTLGEHAVNGFFAISGFLVTMSCDARPWRDYVAARLLRIAPGFVGAVLATALIGAVVTRLPLRDYMADPQLWRFIGTTLTSFKSANTLPGVFEGNPQVYAMAPVWTLRYELYCYGLLLASSLLGWLRRPAIVASVAIGLGLAIAAVDLGWPEARLLLRTFLRLFFLFAIGATLYLWRDRIRLSGPLVAALFGAAYLAHGSALYSAILFAAEAYGAVYLALAPTVADYVPEPRADLSYGIYLYGWPIQQALRHVMPDRAPLALLLLGLGLTVAAATLSWFLIEKPALGFKHRRRKRSPVLDATIPAGPN